MSMSCSYTCLYRDCICLVKKHCQAPCMGVNRNFLLRTQIRKEAFILNVKVDSALYQIDKITLAVDFTEDTQDLAEVVLASQVD